MASFSKVAFLSLTGVQPKDVLDIADGGSVRDGLGLDVVMEQRVLFNFRSVKNHRSSHLLESETLPVVRGVGFKVHDSLHGVDIVEGDVAGLDLGWKSIFHTPFLSVKRRSTSFHNLMCWAVLVALGSGKWLGQRGES
ncbi:hypothetical protein WICPIJ_004356 [Wickerhamomyces pijperi]|uniref:Uncharacterized protein n=1 Tax=Wickerhamomyces pijperi TaxID=599730 RepID=A0A9P8Q856_WICPI|nr:hypothetical protein WICPIJ_004356 [Wickerhamomyces pijperi]